MSLFSPSTPLFPAVLHWRKKVPVFVLSSFYTMFSQLTQACCPHPRHTTWLVRGTKFCVLFRYLFPLLFTSPPATNKKEWVCEGMRSDCHTEFQHHLTWWWRWGKFYFSPLLFPFSLSVHFSTRHSSRKCFFFRRRKYLKKGNEADPKSVCRVPQPLCW